MKSFIGTYIGAALLIFTACTGSSANDTAHSHEATQQPVAHTLTTASWSDSLQDFGTVEKGKQVKMVFHVKNTGDKPLFITSVRPGCGCTVADYTKSAIAAGETGEVAASFDSNKGMGKIHKTIAVVTNTDPAQQTLVFEGVVEEAAKQ